MIIQCPSCSTKFSIDSSRISAVSNPKFHCSRCDYYFDLQAKQKRGSSAAADAQDNSRPEQLSLLKGSELPDAGESSEDSLTMSEEFSSTDLTDEFFDESGANLSKGDSSLSSANATRVTARWPDTISSAPFEADLSEFSGRLASIPPLGEARAVGELGFPETAPLAIVQTGKFAPVIEKRTALLGDQQSGPIARAIQSMGQAPSETTPSEERARSLAALKNLLSAADGPPDGSRDSESLSRPESSPPPRRVEVVPFFETGDELPPSSQMGASYSQSQSPSKGGPSVIPFESGSRKVRENPGTVRSSSGSSSNPFASSLTATRRLMTSPFPLSGGLLTKLSSVLSPVLSPVRLSPMMLALSGPMILTGLFWGWAGNFRSTPEFILSATRLSKSELPRIAPGGFEIVGLQNDIVSLDDGNKVFQVRGTLANSTTRNFRDVLVETRLYDRENRTLGSYIVPAINGLTTVPNVTSLRSEHIEELQAKESSGRAVRANEQLPFRMVVSKVPPETTWISTRVHSVRETL